MYMEQIMWQFDEIQVEFGGRFDVINMLEVIQRLVNYPEMDDDSIDSCSVTQGQHDSPLFLSEEEEIPMEDNFRYKRYDKVQIQPINSDSSSSDDETVLNFEVPTNLNIPETTILIQRIKSKKQKIKVDRKLKKKEKKHKISLKKIEFMDEEMEWDSPRSWELPEQCLRINREHKQENYNKLHDSILACIQGKSKTKAIFLNGAKDIGKKTILFDVVSHIKQKVGKQNVINQYYMTFEEQFSSNIQKKIERLYEYLKRTVKTPFKRSNQCIISQEVQKDINQQQTIDGGLQTVLIIEDYKSFVLTLRQSSIFKKMKKLLSYNKSNLFIFIDSNITKREVQMLALKGYIEISITNNTKTYFTMSLLTAINNYPYKGTRWEMMRPLANYFSTKMDENNKLRLSIIRKLIMFLEKIQKESQSSEQKRRVNGEVIENFMRKFIDRTVKIDLKKLPIHEKAVMSACYVSMKQNISLFLPIKALYKQYSWVCQSISLRAKPFKDFSQDLIFQLSIYKLIKLQNERNSGVEANIILMIDIDAIEHALKDESVLSKFYKR